MMNPKICVVGSSNIDQISYVETIPSDGETVFGNSYQMGFGGKGANQAVMAGLLGAETFMITCLGDDVYADMTIDNYIKCGVNVEHIQRVNGSSGVAPIWVDQSGQNRIIVVSGANDKIDAKKSCLFTFENRKFECINWPIWNTYECYSGSVFRCKK